MFWRPSSSKYAILTKVISGKIIVFRFFKYLSIWNVDRHSLLQNRSTHKPLKYWQLLAERSRLANERENFPVSSYQNYAFVSTICRIYRAQYFQDLIVIASIVDSLWLHDYELHHHDLFAGNIIVFAHSCLLSMITIFFVNHDARERF